MMTRRSIFALLSVALMALLSGCKDAEPELAARWHSVGADGLSSQTGALALRAFFSHSNAPALTERLRPKATRAALEWLSDSAPTDASVAQAQPLVADLLAHESAGEVWRRPDGSKEVFLAVRITAERAPIWNDRYPAVVKPLGSKVSGGWISAEKGWLFAVTPSDSPRAKSFRSRVLSTPSNPSRLLEFQRAPGAWPGIQATAVATNGAVAWTGTLSRPGLSELSLRDWQYPTNLIYDPLVSLTAIRGVTPQVMGLLGLEEYFEGQELGQMYLWAQAESPFQSYAVVHVNDSAPVLQAANAELIRRYSTNVEPGKLDGLVMYDAQKQILGLSSAPGVVPMLAGIENHKPGFLGFSMFRRQRSVQPVPRELLQQLQQPGLVLYDWEITSENFVHWWANLQARDLSLGLNPAPGDGLANAWLTDGLGKVDNTVTQVRQSGPGSFTWSRKAPVGLSALEWVALGRWLDPATPRKPKSARMAPPAPLGLPDAPAAKAPGAPKTAPAPKTTVKP
jgi:hypothetical protein